MAAILRGLRRQLHADRKMSISSLEPGVTGHDEEEVPEDAVEQFYDDVSGGLPPADQVRKARQAELEFLSRFPVYVNVPEGEARGKQRVSVRWCDVNKGD